MPGPGTGTRPGGWETLTYIKWIKRLPYKPANLYFHKYSTCWKPYRFFHLRTFQTSFQLATSACRSMGLEVLRMDLCPLFSSNVTWTTTPTPSNASLRGSRGRQSHTAISCQPTLLVGYTQTYLKRLEHWLRDWRIVVSVPTSTTMLFVEAARVSIFGWPVGILAGETTSLVRDDFHFL